MPKTRKGNCLSLAKGLLFAIAATLAGMLLIAAGVTWLQIPDTKIRFCNQLVKITAIILGTCAAVKRGGEMGLATGSLLSLAYMSLGYCMYISLGGGVFSVSSMLGEMLIGTAVGAITGTIRANLSAGKRRS